MDILTDKSRVERLEIVHTGRRRRFSDAEKIRIVEESFSAPRMGSATARRHGIAVPLIFAWRKAYRDGQLGNEAPSFIRCAWIGLGAMPTMAAFHQSRPRMVQPVLSRSCCAMADA